MVSRRPRWDRMDKTTIPLKAVIEEYLAVCRTEGKTASTLRGYKMELQRFNRWLGEDALLGELNLQSARAYIEGQQGQPKYQNHPFHNPQGSVISAQTLKGRAMVLKGLATWLFEESYTTSNVLDRFKPPKAARKVMQTLSKEEVDRLLSYLNPTSLVGSRDRAILLVFLDTGLRCSELLGLRVNDLHINDRCLKVMGKGQKERVVPFGDQTARSLMRYMTLRSQQMAVWPDVSGIHYVFLTVDGQPMSVPAIQMMFSRLSKATGIPRLHIHLLRHTFATNFLRVSRDPFTLQRILGHETLEMTRRYVDMVRLEEITRDHSFSPVDRMGFGGRSGRRGWG